MRAILLEGTLQLEERFDGALLLTLRAGEALGGLPGSRRSIYRLQTGWACQYRELANCRKAIVGVYLPGDLIGLDALFNPKSLLHKTLSLTSLELKAVDAHQIVRDLLASQRNPLYIVWLLARRQRRTEYLLTTISCLDARGRMAAIDIECLQAVMCPQVLLLRSFRATSWRDDKLKFQQIARVSGT